MSHTSHQTESNARRLILHLADDALIYGQRLSEWSSRGPTLEFDIALSNTALAYLGRARMLFALYAELKNEGHDEDHYAMLRGEREYTNLWIYEIDNTDFARAVVRQYLIDLFEVDYFERLTACPHQGLSAIANKSILEIRYNIQRTHNWLEMLAMGTEESHRRLERALADLWGYADEFFINSSAENSLIPNGYPNRESLREPYFAQLKQTLNECNLTPPESNRSVQGGRLGIHSDALGHLLSDLQYMQRTYPGLKW